MSIAFVGKGAKKNPNKSKLIQTIGEYYYHSLVLANFDPVQADLIFDNPAHKIAEASVAMMAHNYRD